MESEQKIKPWELHPVFRAFIKNNIRDIFCILYEIEDINEPKDEFGNSIMHLSASRKDPKFISYALERGGDIHLLNENKETPLMSAIKAGCEDNAWILLKRLQPFTAPTKNEKNALVYACSKGYTDIVNCLITLKGESVNSSDGEYAIHHATKGNHHEVVDLLLKRGVYPDNTCSEGDPTALFIACRQGNMQIVRLLVDAGADVNREDSHNQTPLHTAAYYGHADIVQYLLNRGADIDVRDICNNTPLHVAARNTCNEAFKVLIKNGASTNARNQEGLRPLLTLKPTSTNNEFQQQFSSSSSSDDE